MSNDAPNLTSSFADRVERWKANLRAWREDIKTDPAAIWNPQPVRIALWVTLGIILLIAARWASTALLPRGDAGKTEAPTTLATLYLACAEHACRHSFTARVERDQVNWPLLCEKCGGKSAWRATLCKKCRNWWAKAPGSAPGCPYCEERALQEAKAHPEKPAASRPRGEDDDW